MQGYVYQLSAGPILQDDWITCEQLRKGNEGSLFIDGFRPISQAERKTAISDLIHNTLKDFDLTRMGDNCFIYLGGKEAFANKLADRLNHETPIYQEDVIAGLRHGSKCAAMRLLLENPLETNHRFVICEDDFDNDLSDEPTKGSDRLLDYLNYFNDGEALFIGGILEYSFIRP